MRRVERFVVWAGGAAFVASLAVCTWWYLAVLGRWTRPDGSAVRNLALDTVLFSVFALHHTLLARNVAKRVVASWLPPRLVRSFYVWIASALLVAVCVLWQPIGGDLYAMDGVRAALFVAIQLAGVWLIAQSVRAIDPLELAGIRGPGTLTGGDGLQIGGPYALVRHPVYLGWILALFAHPHMTGDRLAFAVISTAYLLAAVPLEERSLAAAVGAAYDEYRRRVRWRVIPFVY